MQLSTNFSLNGFIKSATAIRLGIDNTPSNDHIDAMTELCENVLQKVRDHFGRVDVNSGFRCLLLNRALRSNDTSQHLMGEAGDIEVGGVSNYDLACWIRDNCEFDKVILEFYTSGDPSSGWVHVSFRGDSSDEDNRGTCWTISSSGTVSGLVK